MVVIVNYRIIEQMQSSNHLSSAYIQIKGTDKNIYPSGILYHNEPTQNFMEQSKNRCKTAILYKVMDLTKKTISSDEVMYRMKIGKILFSVRFCTRSLGIYNINDGIYGYKSG